MGDVRERLSAPALPAPGQTINVDLALPGVTTQELAESVEHELQRISPRSFPVGWGRYHALPHDKFRCESCVGAA